MKALITGATGFIGSHLVEALFSRCYSLKCLVRPTSDLKWIENLKMPEKVCNSPGLPSMDLVYGDCLDSESLANAVADCDYIFHLAGLTRTFREEEFFSVNVEGTENLLQAAINSGKKLKRFIFLSSLSAVGPCLSEMPVDEETKPHPASSYGKSKLEAEKAVLYAGEKIPVTVIRPPAVYGPRDRDFFLLFKLIKSGIFPHWGKSRYSLVYIDDLINGIIRAAESDIAEGKTYFISDMEEYNSDEIAIEIAGIFEKSLRKVRIPHLLMPLVALISEKLSGHGIINRDKMRELTHQCWVCNSTLAFNDLQYRTEVPLRKGLQWTADWYRINKWI